MVHILPKLLAPLCQIISLSPEEKVILAHLHERATPFQSSCLFAPVRLRVLVILAVYTRMCFS